MNNNLLELNLNGYKVVRELGEKTPWKVYLKGKLMRSFKSFHQVCLFVFPKDKE